MNIYDNTLDAIEFINHLKPMIPEVGIVLGSGLGEFANHLKDKTSIPFENIPHFKKAGVKGHEGKLVLGKIGETPIAILQGRYHYYEGHDIRDVVFPIRVLCTLGIKALLLTNAAGGINPSFSPGDLMIIRDHINLMGINPLNGENDDRLGKRFPDMSDVYNNDFLKIISDAIKSMKLNLRTGVYAALSGPSYETPAEIRMLSIVGADAVGMSTVPEAIVARHMGMKVAGISCITNFAAGISKTKLDHKEVTETANRVKPHFINLLKTIIPKF
jgi:purine-nucleoside phosphorylase